MSQYKIDEKSYKYTVLATALIISIAAFYTIRKIFHGSKSIFAYTLMTFSIFDAAHWLLYFFIMHFKNVNPLFDFFSYYLFWLLLL
jgi:hypothetical protein